MITLLLAITLPSICLATDDAALRSEIEKMLVMTKMDKMMEPMYNQIEGMLQNQVMQMGITEEQQPIVEKYYSQIFDLLRSEMSWDQMRDQYIDIYAKVYTIEEIKAITTFYNSEVGIKMLEKMPQLMQESMSIGQTSLQPLFPKIQEISQQMVSEIMTTKESGTPQQ
jgi:hypothetical protein